MLQRLGAHGSIFQKYNSITWNVTFSGVFIHYGCVTVITAPTSNRLHRLKSLFALQKYSFKLFVDTFKNGFPETFCLGNVFIGSLLVIQFGSWTISDCLIFNFIVIRTSFGRSVCKLQVKLSHVCEPEQDKFSRHLVRRSSCRSPQNVSAAALCWSPGLTLY